MTLEEALKLHLEKGGKCGTSLSGWSIIYDDETIREFSRHPCYASMNGVVAHRGLKDGKPVLILNDLSQVSKAWLEWLIKESPFKSTYASVDVDKAFKYKTTIHKANVPANLLVGSMQAERMMWEHAPLVKKFCDLVEVCPNLNKNFIYLLALQSSNEQVLSFREKADEPSHTWWPYNFSYDFNIGCKYIYNFLMGSPKNLNKTYKSGASYHGINSLWGNIKDNRAFNVWLWQKICAYGKNVDVKSANPFQKAKVGKQEYVQLSKDNAQDILQKIYDEFIQEMQDA